MTNEPIRRSPTARISGTRRLRQLERQLERPFALLGVEVLELMEGLGQLVLLVRDSMGMIVRLRIHRFNTMEQLSRIGVDSLPIALLTSLSTGMVFALQTADQFIKFGAASIIGGATALALTRELAPLLTSVVVAGRNSSSIAAEIGSMKVTEQIDAMVSLGVDPVYYLVVPRLIACVIMLPLLTMLALVIGLVGAYIVAVIIKGTASSGFFESIQQFVSVKDLLKGLFKAAIFGFVIATVSCHKGLGTEEGAQGVGRSTTNAVVVSLITIFILNYFLSVVLYSGVDR